jgi:TolA-binding protein
VVGSGNTTNNTMYNVNRQSVNAVGGNTFAGGLGGYGGYGAGYGGYGAYGGYGGYGWSTPYRGYYDDWHQGNWGWYQPAAAVTGAALGWLAGAGSGYTYDNPYYSAPVEDVPAALSYAQPLVIQVPPAEPVPPQDITIIAPEATATATATASSAPTPALTPPPTPEPPKEEPPADPAVRDAIALMDEARAAFAKGEYALAQQLIEKGIQKLPGDATLHEFRALTQFAQKKYKDAAATIYAVLNAGPGWNWDTLKSFYSSEETYKQHLRALEAYARDNPKAPEIRFLLAYHYLVLDAKEAAISQLEQTVRFSPKDQLSVMLLQALLKTPSPDDRPQPQP